MPAKQKLSADIGPNIIRYLMDENKSRCDRAELAGGIRHQDVVEAGKGAPPGYWLDHLTMWWIPDGVSLEAGSA